MGGRGGSKCKYCTQDYGKYSKIETQDEDIESYIDPQGGKLIIKCFVDDNEDPYIMDGAIKINYCPMCGRKLHD